MTKSKPKKTIAKRGGTKAPSGPKRTAKRVAKQQQGIAPGFLGAIGQTAGSFLGGSSLGKLGKRAGDWLGRITGMGEYSVNKNVLLTGDVPSFRSENNGTAIVTHREFITDVSGSTAFTNVVRSVNPGLSDTFPWLSRIAANYEQYEFLGLIFEFKSTSADALNSTNTALGTVVAATQYDSLDEPFTGKQQMEAYQFATSTVPSRSMIHPVECDPRQNALTNMYIRTAPVASGQDQRFYDLGNFELATTGMQASAVIGELWVSYCVKLLKPKLTGASAIGASAHYTGAPLLNMFDSTQLVTGYSNLVTPVANTMNFNYAGRYTVVFSSYSPSSQTWQSSVPTFNGGAVGVTSQSGLSRSYNQSQTAAVNTWINVTTVNVVSLPAWITWGGPQAFGGSVYSDIWVTATPPGINESPRVPMDRIDLRVRELERRLSILDPPSSAIVSDEEEMYTEHKHSVTTPLSRMRPLPPDPAGGGVPGYLSRQKQTTT